MSTERMTSETFSAELTRLRKIPFCGNQVRSQVYDPKTSSLALVQLSTSLSCHHNEATMAEEEDDDSVVKSLTT